MPVKMLPDGTVVFDTVDEALDYTRRSKVVPAAPRRITPKATIKRPAKKAAREAAPPAKNHPRLRVSAATRSLMSAVRSVARDEIKSEDFASAIGVRTTQLPQMFMQLTKELRSINMTADQVVVRRKIYDKGRAKSVYQAGPRIVEAIRRAEASDAPLFKEGPAH